ncbi:DapH/DapD/GlmU-related protein [Mediterranea massiliensis]|uniref:DapH/DapD/GlmU-related protein n=1 Tax=Mediterranea massiliensis TaxID=1841865 RepID=UPI0025A4BEC3|nr:DapH/DapD/GlmU-related protein [Mediterranea massiliensis]MDM8338441.1 DapH/DapD/GlmU-related protein [Mediterranea massiliensis]
MQEKGYGLLSMRLSQIAKLLSLSILGNDIMIDGLNLSNRFILSSSVLSYCTSLVYFKKAIVNSKVKALIVTSNIYNELSVEEKQMYSFIINDFPESTFYSLFLKLAQDYYPKYSWHTNLGDTLVMKGAVIEDGVILGKNVVIGNNSVIKAGTIIGDNVTIGSCSVIGGEGFQLIKDAYGMNMTIPHVGRVRIGNNVSIGDNSTISKSLFEGFTTIGDYTKMDNHVHIAHNCVVGQNCTLAANCTMFGSSELKNNVWVAPNAAIMNRVVVGEGAFIGASSFVFKNVKAGAKMFGVPAVNIN